jgi:hypothetical protein
VDCSTVLDHEVGAADSECGVDLASPWPGIGTQESRGMETSVGVPNHGTCITMMVSVRPPSTEPVWSCSFWSSVRPARLSLPTSRKLVPEEVTLLVGSDPIFVTDRANTVTTAVT